jgi:hypothetical protein
MAIDPSFLAIDPRLRSIQESGDRSTDRSTESGDRSMGISSAPQLSLDVSLSLMLMICLCFPLGPKNKTNTKHNKILNLQHKLRLNICELRGLNVKHSTLISVRISVDESGGKGAIYRGGGRVW